MLLSRNELQERLELMADINVSANHRMMLVYSALDTEYEEFIKLIDELSSAVWWMVADVSNPKHTEKHMEARQRLIEKFKEFCK